MPVYSYRVKRRYLSDTENECLLGGDEVLCACSPGRLQLLYCADFQFPNGDTFPLLLKAVKLDSSECIA